MAYDIGPKIGIDGESEFRKQLRNVSEQLKTLGSEMGVVTAQFAKNADSQQALSAKSSVLRKEITAQKELLKMQEDALAKSTAKFGEADSKTQKWARAVNESRAKLLNMENALNDTGKELDDTGGKALSFGDVLKANVIGDVIVKGLETVVGLVRDMGGEFLNSAASVKASSSQFTQTFGDMAGDAEAAIDRVAEASGILDTRLQGAGTKIYAFAKSAGGDSAKSLDIMERAMVVAADSAAYYDRSLEDTLESLQSFMKGNFSNDAALGLSATETTRNAAAMELFGQKYKDLTEIQKQETLLKMVEDSMALSGAMGQAQREASGWENVQGNLTESWKQFQAVIGTPFLENITPIIQDVTAGLSDLTENTDWTAFSEGVTAAFDAIRRLLDGDTSGIQGLRQKLMDSLVGGMGSLGTYLQENLPDMVSVGAEIVKNLVSGLVEGASSLIGAAASMAAQVGQGLQEAVPDIVAAGLNIAGNLAANIRESAGTLADAAVSMAQNLAQGLADSIPTIIEKVPRIVSDIAGVINDNAPKLLGAAANIIGTLLQGLIDAVPTLLKNIPQILKALWDAFTAFQWLNLGKTIMQAVGKGITSAKTFLAEQAGKIGDDLIGYFKGLPARLKTIGSDLIDGLVKGITGKFEALASNISSIASKVTGLFTSAWDTHSPSKVFASIGAYLMEGLAIGMENGKGEVMETVDDIANEISTRFKDITGVLNQRSNISDLQYDLWEMTAGKTATDMEKYEKQMELLNDQYQNQEGVLEAAQAAYESIAAQYGENSAEAYSYMETLLQEQIEYQKLADSIQAVIDKQRELSASMNVAGSYADVAGRMTSGSGNLSDTMDRASANMVNGMSAAMSGYGSGDLLVEVNVGDAKLARALLPAFRQADKSNPEVVSDAL